MAIILDIHWLESGAKRGKLAPKSKQNWQQIDIVKNFDKKKTEQNWHKNDTKFEQKSEKNDIKNETKLSQNSEKN